MSGLSAPVGGEVQWRARGVHDVETETHFGQGFTVARRKKEVGNEEVELHVLDGTGKPLRRLILVDHVRSCV